MKGNKEKKRGGVSGRLAVFEFGTSPGWPKAFLILNGGFWKQKNATIARPLSCNPSSISLLCNCFSIKTLIGFSAHHCICGKTESDNIKCMSYAANEDNKI